MPVYFAVETEGILDAWRIILVAIVGVLLGTFYGVKLLREISPRIYPRLLSFLILALGIFLHGMKLL